MKAIRSLIKESYILVTIILIFVLFLAFIIYFNLKIELFTLFQTITENRIILISILSLFAIMFFLVLYNLYQIITDRIKNKVGSKFRFRLTLFFLIIASIPLFPLSLMSNNLISSSINLWFVGGIEDSLKDAVEVSKELYNKLSEESREEWEKLCVNCEKDDIMKIQFAGIDGVFKYISDQGRMVGLSAKDTSLMETFESFKFDELKIENWKRLIIQDNEYILTPVVSKEIGEIILVRIIPEHIRNYTAGISLGLQNYRTLKIIRGPIKGIIILFYIGVTIPFVLLSFYLSLIISREVTVPIKELVIATQKVAMDELDYKITLNAKDDLKLLVKSFNKMTEDLRLNKELLKHSERSAAWRDIARRIAHEIKNPLTPIKLAAERLLKHYKKKDGYLDILTKGTRTIITEVDNINDMVNEFSSFAQFPEAEFEKHDIIAIIYEIMGFLKDTYRNISFSFNHREGTVYLFVDKNQIRRAILNIIYNSINAILQQGNVWIEGYTPRGKKDHYIISISDNGRGIEDNIKDRIFEPYFSKNGKGSGLGLAIVQRIVLDNRGKIWFDSKPGKTIFYLEFNKV